MKAIADTSLWDDLSFVGLVAGCGLLAFALLEGLPVVAAPALVVLLASLLYGLR